MEIKQISTIENYKSFQSFVWADLCKVSLKDRSIVIKEFSKFNVIFGENGTGKTSISEILQLFSQEHNVDDNLPIYANSRIVIESDEGNNTRTTHTFESNKWDTDNKSRPNILLFDSDYVNSNVHTHGARSNLKDKHAQNSGKLIIELDATAHNLRTDLATKKKELEMFQKSNKEVLNRVFSESEMKMYHGMDQEAHQAGSILLDIDQYNKDQEQLKQLKINQDKSIQIQAIKSIDTIKWDAHLPGAETLRELFTINLHQLSHAQADNVIKEHFDKHRGVIEQAMFYINAEENNEKCPVCTQPLGNVPEVIKYYRSKFDQSYAKAKQRFLDDIEKSITSLKSIQESYDAMLKKINIVFSNCENLENNFKIGVYSSNEREQYTKLDAFPSPAAEINQLTNQLNALKQIDGSESNNFDQNNYNNLQIKLDLIISTTTTLDSLIGMKNDKILAFKKTYTGSKEIIHKIDELNGNIATYKSILNFNDEGKFQSIKVHNEVTLAKEKIKKGLSEAKETLNSHLETNIPQNLISKMEYYINDVFKMNFKVQHTPTVGQTSEYAFGFNITDQDGKPRNFNKGISDGERQAISLAFFFAMNENFSRKDKTILIFDDPITSLDSRNLKKLAELIYQQSADYSQAVILTHHPLFYKYLIKGPRDDLSTFTISKNKQSLGGSFIFCEKDFDIIKELEAFDNELKRSAENAMLNMDRICFKYGQLLRLAVEKFIKNDLLLWNKERNFAGQVIQQLSASKSKIIKLEEYHITSLTEIFNYCNQSNLLHNSKEAHSSTNELKLHIDKFLEVKDQVEN